MSLPIFQDQLPDSFNPRVEIGTTGLKTFSGKIDEEFLLRLRGKNAARTYDEMRKNSPILGAALNAVTMLINQVSWRVEPANDSLEAIREAEDTKLTLFEDMETSWEDFIDEGLSVVPFGFAPFEQTWKIRRGDTRNKKTKSMVDDGLWGIRKLELRGQDTIESWVPDKDGDLAGIIQQASFTEGHSDPRGIPWGKMHNFRLDTYKNNPEGMSMLRPAVIPYWMVKNIQEFEATGIERDLAGMPLFEVPSELLLPDAPPELRALKAQLERFVTGVRRDEYWGGLIPSETTREGTPSCFKFKLLTTGGKRQIPTDAIIKRYEARMLMLFMAQFLLMGTDRTGSFALATNSTDLFSIAIRTILRKMVTVINKDIVSRRQRMNGKPVELDPKVVHGDIRAPDLDELGRYIMAISQAGVGIGAPARRKLVENANLPVPPPDSNEEIAGEMAEMLIDQSNRGLNDDQVRTILEINAAVSRGELDRDTAITVMAMSMGVKESFADAFLSKAPAPLPPPTDAELMSDGTDDEDEDDATE